MICQKVLNVKLALWMTILSLAPPIPGSDFAGINEHEIFFNINWPGKSIVNYKEADDTKLERYVITSPNNEKYQCFIPETKPEPTDYIEKFQGVDPMEFLEPLFNQNTCSFRLESYWTYEICHGRYVRQYHEEREGKKVKTQEYYLGTFDKAKNSRNRALGGPPVKTVEGIQVPYVEVEMTEGTLCDLNNKRRSIKLLYICHEHGKQEIFSLEETSTCEYEAIVLSRLVCYHPDYRARAVGEHDINCLPLDNAPKKPRSLLALEAESQKFRQQKITDEKAQKVQAIFHIDREAQDGETRVRVEIHPVDVAEKSSDENGNSGAERTPTVTTAAQNFFSSKNCLHGGNGWWKYEFCYGQSVVQYHIERDGSRTNVNLGNFNKEKHIAWLEAHPQKRPKRPSERKQLSHFYSDGNPCDKTGKLRQTEVRLRCLENPTASPSSVSLFLLEPKTCEYILGVESPLICNMLVHADENGLTSRDVNFNEDKSLPRPETKKEESTEEQETDDMDARIANGDE